MLKKSNIGILICSLLVCGMVCGTAHAQNNYKERMKQAEQAVYEMKEDLKIIKAMIYQIYRYGARRHTEKQYKELKERGTK